MPAPSVEHQWVENNREKILDDVAEEANSEEEAEEEDPDEGDAQGAKGVGEGDAKRGRHSPELPPRRQVPTESGKWHTEIEVQTAVNEYMDADAKRLVPFGPIPRCVEPSLIWQSPDVELWLGGINHLWEPRNIPKYTTAGRVPVVV